MALTTGLASPHAPTAGALYSRIPEYGAFAGIANAGKHVGRDPEASEFAADSPVEEDGFEPVWGFSCQAVVLGCADSFLFGAGKAVFRPVACDQVRGARGRGQGTETVAKLGGLPA